MLVNSQYVVEYGSVFINVLTAVANITTPLYNPFL